MSNPQPRVRSDLIFSRQEHRDGVVYVLKDPARRQFFRFQEVEHFIIQRLDGTHAPEAIQHEVQERFGGLISSETLAQFIEKLGAYGLLDSGSTRSPRRPTTRNSILFARFKAFDPDRLLGFLVHKTRFLFTPAFLTLSGLTVFAAILVVATNGAELVHDVFGLNAIGALLLAWVIILIVGMAHEFAHGLTCKHFGGEVHEIGFLLLYFQPALYCNVSDAWLFPEKRNRLWVTFAGSYFELFLWALSVLVWRVTSPDNLVHDVSLIVATTSGIKTLLNFNPLLKLDGYYLLCDLLDVANLRRNAFQEVGARLRRLLGSDARQRVTASPREQRIHLAYGLLAITFSFAFLVFLTIRLGGSLLMRYHAYGIVPFAVLLGVAVQRRVVALMPNESVAAKPDEPGAAKPRVKRHRLKRLLIGVVAAALMALPLAAPMELKVAGEFTIIPRQQADVRSQLDGFVSEVQVHEGAQIRQGDPIARLHNRDYSIELQKSDGELQEKRVLLKYSQANVERFRALFKADVVSRNDYENAEQQVAVNQAEVTRLEAQRRNTQDQLRQVEIVSPISGVVTTSARQLTELNGKFVKKGDLIAQIFELRTVTAEIAVPEKEIADVVIGQPVVLKTRAYPQNAFMGRVTSIATIVQDASGDAPSGASARSESTPKYVLVTTLLDNASMMLKPHMTGVAKIRCGRYRVAELLVRRLARTFRVEFWSWW